MILPFSKMNLWTDQEEKKMLGGEVILNKNKSISKIGEFGPAEEYETLREELLQAKKYIFERPLLIAAIAAAGSRELNREFLLIILVLTAALLLFNFWFTINRIFSSARISAYIQLELEERMYGRWIGWETCLREYRKWKNLNEKNPQPDPDFIPFTFMYYKEIYMLHIGLMALTVSISLILAIHDHTWLSITAAVFVLVLLCMFAIAVLRFKPSRIIALIEVNRRIWISVFERMQKNGLK